jgi:hypothetical protein
MDRGYGGRRDAGSGKSSIVYGGPSGSILNAKGRSVPAAKLENASSTRISREMIDLQPAIAMHI